MIDAFVQNRECESLCEFEPPFPEMAFDGVPLPLISGNVSRIEVMRITNYESFWSADHGGLLHERALWTSYRATLHYGDGCAVEGFWDGARWRFPCLVGLEMTNE